MSDHIPDVTKMVPDGYYTALVHGDTGGEISTHVRVLDGIPRNARGATLRRDACRDYMPVCVEDFCRAWPWDAAMELGALRTANAALVERVKRLEEAGDRLEELLGDPPNANCSCHISPPCNDCFEWAAIREAKAEWTEAQANT
jgi:hypothetical protein